MYVKAVDIYLFIFCSLRQVLPFFTTDAMQVSQAAKLSWIIQRMRY